MNLIDLQIIILLDVLVILAICSYSDLKHHKADNKYTFLIALLCIPLILFNTIELIHIALIVILLLCNKFNAIGGADIKALIPLMASLPMVGILIFWKLALTSFIGLVIAFVVRTKKLSWKMEVPFMPSIFIGVLGYVVYIITN